jgi:uncharacterized membrane protein
VIGRRTTTRRRRDRGAVIPIVALSLTMLMTMTAFAVDLGRMRTERRDLQADADAIALDAVQMVVGMRAVDALPIALTEANESAARNDVGLVLTDQHVAVGTWDFTNHDFVAAASDDVIVDAVEVRLSDMVEMHFDFTTDERSVSRRAVAVAQGAARGEVGSVLAGLQQTVDPVTAPCRIQQQVSFMNSIYTAMLGITSNVEVSADAEVDSGPCEITTPAAGLQLDAVSWRGLGYGRATLDDIAAEMGLGSRDALFANTVDARNFLQATATVLQNSPDVLDAEAGGMLGTIVAAMTNTSQIDVGALVDPGSGDPLAAAGGAATGDDSAASAGVDALSLLTGTAMLIDGENLASAEVPLNLPYLREPVTTRIHLIEPPRTHEDLRLAGQDGPSTASARIAIDVPLKDLELDLSLLGLVGTELAPGDLRFVVEVGRATSTYERIACPTGGATEVDMSVDPDAVSIGYGAALDDQVTGGFDVNPSVQVDAELSLLYGTVTLDLRSMTDVEESLTFDSNLSVSGLSAAEIALLGAPSSNTFTDFGPGSPWHRYPGGVSGTKLTDVTYAEIQYNSVLGSVLSVLGVSQLTVEGMVRNALDSATDSIVEDIGANVIDPLLHSLGITVAGADGRILEVTCQMPALANRG